MPVQSGQARWYACRGQPGIAGEQCLPGNGFGAWTRLWPHDGGTLLSHTLTAVHALLGIANPATLAGALLEAPRFLLVVS